MHEPEPQATALRLLPEACPPSREEPPSPSSKFQPCQPDSVTLPAIGQSYTGLRVTSAQQTLVNRPLRAIGPPPPRGPTCGPCWSHAQRHGLPGDLYLLAPPSSTRHFHTSAVLGQCWACSHSTTLASTITADPVSLISCPHYLIPIPYSVPSTVLSPSGDPSELGSLDIETTRERGCAGQTRCHRNSQKPRSAWVGVA